MEILRRLIGAKTVVLAAIIAAIAWLFAGVTPGAQDAPIVARAAAETWMVSTIPAAAWPAFIWAHFTDLAEFFNVADAALLIGIFAGLLAAVAAWRWSFHRSQERGILDPGAEVLEVQEDGTIRTYRLPKPTLRERLASLAKRLGLASSKPSENTPSGQN